MFESTLEDLSATYKTIALYRDQVVHQITLKPWKSLQAVYDYSSATSLSVFRYISIHINTKNIISKRIYSFDIFNFKNPKSTHNNKSMKSIRIES